MSRMAQAHHVEILQAVLINAVPGPLGIARTHSEGDILQGTEPRQQRVPLEDDAPIQGRAGEFTPRHDRHAAGRLVQPRQYVEDCRLAAAGMAQHTDEFAGIDTEAHIFKHSQIGPSAHSCIYLR